MPEGYETPDKLLPKAQGFYWTMNVGQALQVLALLLTLGGYLWYAAVRQAETQKDLDASKERAIKYVPMIENSAKLDELQSMQITNLTEAVKDIKISNNQVLITLGSVKEDIASIKSRLGSSFIEQQPPVIRPIKKQ